MTEVEITRDGAVLTITLNRPDVLNALNRAVHDGIAAGLEEAKDPAVRAVVITGAGRGFCVGQDLQEFGSGAGDVAQNLRDNYHRNVLAIRALEKPVIAAVNGAAAGAGMSLALACDARIAADSASFVPAFIKIGLVPDSGGTWLVRRLLGTARAFEWLTTGRRVDAEEARGWGLVNEVVPAGELLARAREVAELYAAMPTRAVWHTKRLLDAAEDSSFEEQLELEARTQAELTRTPDFTEGVAAFLEKRDARFTGADVEWPHPIRLVVNDDLERWRLTVALRWLLALPHLLVLTAWTYLRDPGGDRQLGDRRCARPAVGRSARMGGATRSLPGARLRLRVPRRRSRTRRSGGGTAPIRSISRSPRRRVRTGGRPVFASCSSFPLTCSPPCSGTSSSSWRCSVPSMRSRPAATPVASAT